MGYKIRSVIRALDVDTSPTRVTFKCWRVTIYLAPDIASTVSLDGVPAFGSVLALGGAGTAVCPVVLGGVVLNGAPVNYEHEHYFRGTSGFVAGGIFIVEEYIDPIP